jgi:hypothetical protein
MLELGEIQATARTLGLAVATSEIRRAEDIVSAFEALKGRADGIYVVADPLVFSNGGPASTPWPWPRGYRRSTTLPTGRADSRVIPHGHLARRPRGGLK